MSLADVKTHLEKAKKDNPDLDYSHIVDAINSASKVEKDKGIRETNKRNEENKKLRKFKKVLEDDLGFDPDTELDDFVSGIKDKVKKSDNGHKATGELADLTTKFNSMSKDFSKMQKSNKEKDEENKKLASKARGQTMQADLSKALGGKIYGADDAIYRLINDGRVGLAENGKTVFKDGDSEVDFDDGVKSFLEKNKDIVKSKQNGGGGSTPGAPKNFNKGDTILRSDFESMPLKARSQFIVDGGKVTD